jgi:hypothetical protein
MFDKLLETLSVDIATVRAIVQTNEKLRIIIFSDASDTKPELLENAEFKSLLEVIPDERNWQVYDRCAVVTRLYAIYEKFVRDLIADLVTYHVILEKKKPGKAREIGQITEWYKKPQAAVAKLKNIKLSVGNPLFLVNESIFYCQSAKVESIQINDVSHNEVEIATETEVGLKFNTDGKKGLSLYVIE